MNRGATNYNDVVRHSISTLAAGAQGEIADRTRLVRNGSAIFAHRLSATAERLCIWMSLQHRQGDLLFIQQANFPHGPLQPRQGNVIVEGEATGHAHRLQAGTILEAPDGTLYLDVTQTTQIVHEEHGPITLDPGLWLVLRQQEYSPKAIKEVRD